MKGHRLGTIMGIKVELSHVLKEIPADYQSYFHAWKRRMHKCICAPGDHLEGDRTDVDEKIQYFFNRVVANFVVRLRTGLLCDYRFWYSQFSQERIKFGFEEELSPRSTSPQPKSALV